MRSARLAHPRDEWQCVSHCHSVSNASNRHALGASGSAIGAAGTPKGRVAVRLTLPLGVERIESERPRGEWQCAWYVQGRVEVWFTLPLGGERTGRNVEGRVAVRIGAPKPEWQCDRCAQGRVEVREEKVSTIPTVA